LNAAKARLFIFILLSVSGALLVLVCTSKYGAGLTHDSAAYVYAAKGLLTGKGYVYFGYGTPFVQWPPIFPTLLAIMAGIGLDPISAARFVNAGVFGLIVFSSGLWFSKHIRNRALAVLGQASVLLSIPLLYVSTYMWTEPLFVLLIILFLFKLEDFLKYDRLKDLIFSAVFATLACLTRYIGVTAILTGVLLLLIQKRGFLKKLYHVTAFGFISCVPLALWILRNYFVFSTTVGSRTASQFTLRQNLEHTFNTAVSWFIPYARLAGIARVLVTAAAVVLAVCLIFIAVWNSRKNTGAGASGYQYSYSMPVLPLAGFLLIYTAYLVASAASVAIDAINNRLLAPVYIPLVVILFVGLDGLHSLLLKNGIRRIWGLLPVVVGGLWLLYPFFNTVVLTRDTIEDGAGGYSSDKWRYSETIEYMNSSGEFSGCKVFSNYPDAVYLLTGLQAQYTPKKTGQYEYGFERFRRTVNQGGCAYVVWFKSNMAGTIYDVDELSAAFDLEPVVKKTDGVVYMIGQRKYE